MSGGTWAHRATHPLVRPLVGSRVNPNHLTALRLATGLAAVACFATGAAAQGGTWFLVSAYLDRADGELARLAGLTSRTGHYFDIASDVLVTCLAFVGIGIGLQAHPQIGAWALTLGAVAGMAVAAIFWLVYLLEADGHSGVPGVGGFDADDTLFLVAPLAWVGWLPHLLVAAALGAPVFLLVLALIRRGRTEKTPP